MALSPANQATGAIHAEADERAILRESLLRQIGDMPVSKLRALALIADELEKHDVEVNPAKIGNVIVQPHPDYGTVLALKAAASYALESVANRHGIFDLAQDNGIRTLEVMLLKNLLVVGGRNGNDLRDGDGVEIELKTLNLDVAKDFSSHRQLNLDRIDKYSRVAWIFCFYQGPTMLAAYALDPAVLAGKFEEWRKLCRQTGKSQNNPKIPSSHVIEYGTLLWGKPPNLKGWKKVDKKTRRAAPAISERSDVTAISPALALSLLRYEQNPPMVQISLSLDAPDNSDS